MDDPVYVINLDRSTQRLADFVSQNASTITFERFSAIVGADLSRERLVAEGIIHAGIPYTAGAIGNALSHREFWLRSIASGRTLTVCEDDAIFNRGFDRIRAEALSEMRGSFDYILWGWNFDGEINFDFPSGFSPCVAAFNQDILRNSIDAFVAAEFRPSLFKLRRAFGTVCYTVSPSGAMKLLSNCFPLRPDKVFFPLLDREVPNVGIDVAASAIYPLMDAYISFPPAVITKNDKRISTLKE